MRTWKQKKKMNEEYGHIPDAFQLSQKEIEELRKNKNQLTQYAKEKLKELKEKLKDDC